MKEENDPNLNDFFEMIDEQTREQAHQKIAEFAEMMAWYRCAIMEIETKFNVFNEEFSHRFDHNPISSIKTRLKSPGSIKEKLDRKGLPVTTTTIQESLNDIAGVRVICMFPEDVYRLADALLQQDDITLIKKKDYIKTPKPSGYRSLHLIVEVPVFLSSEKRMMRAEIQLRTIAMDFWASLEHQLRYKKDHIFTEEMQKELTECAEISAELDLRMDQLRKGIT